MRGSIRIGNKRMTKGPILHEEMAEVLREHGGGWMTMDDVYQEVIKRGRYKKKRGKPETFPDQIFLRARKYPKLFELEGREKVKLIKGRCKDNLVAKGNFRKTFWRKVIKNFESHFDHYEKILYKPKSKKPDDLSQGYYYNERATLGFFALALFNAGADIILQEFTTERGKRRRASSGRCDLLAIFNKKAYYFEVKQCWPSITKDNFSLKELDDCRDEARKQLRTLKEARRSHNIAVLFIVPYQTKDSYNDYKNRINQLWKRMKISFSKDSSLLFLYLPKRGPGRWDGYCYPGVILLLEPYNEKLK